MAEKTISIDINRKSYGSIMFDETPPSLELKKTALGYNLPIQALVQVNWDDRNEPQPILTNVRFVISCYEGDAKLELGRVKDETVYFGTTFGKGDAANFDWINVGPALIYLEGIRGKSPPKLNFYVRAELQFLVRAVRVPPPNVIVVEPGYNNVVSFPHKISGEVDINYPNTVWNGLIAKMFKATG